MRLTRNAEDYSIHNAKKMFSDRSIRVTEPTLCNSADTKIKHCKPLNTLGMSSNQV